MWTVIAVYIEFINTTDIYYFKFEKLKWYDVSFFNCSSFKKHIWCKQASDSQKSVVKCKEWVTILFRQHRKNFVTLL